MRATRSTMRWPRSTGSKVSRRVLVSGFDPDGVAAFVEAASGVPIGAIEPRVVDVLAAQTDGNPFLLGELWRHLVETGALRRDDRRDGLAGPDLDAVTSPESVRSVVARRIDRLPGDARQLLEVAAVIGPAFPVDLLRRDRASRRRRRARATRTRDRERDRRGARTRLVPIRTRARAGARSTTG